jgi:hypothetical protein
LRTEGFLYPFNAFIFCTRCSGGVSCASTAAPERRGEILDPHLNLSGVERIAYEPSCASSRSKVPRLVIPDGVSNVPCLLSSSCETANIFRFDAAPGGVVRHERCHGAPTMIAAERRLDADRSISFCRFDEDDGPRVAATASRGGAVGAFQLSRVEIGPAAANRLVRRERVVGLANNGLMFAVKSRFRQRAGDPVRRVAQFLIELLAHGNIIDGLSEYCQGQFSP